MRSAPGGETLAYQLASRYFAGVTIEDALATAHRLAAQGVLSSIDFFGENVFDPVEADRVTDEYLALAGRIATEAPAGTYLSLDLSHVALDERRLARIAAALPAGAQLQVGAEQAARTDRILDAVLAVAGAGGSVSATVQANLLRTPADAHRLAEAGVPIRLVKGAYVETRRWRSLSAIRPTSPSPSSPTGFTAQARSFRWRHTTRYCGKRCCRRFEARAWRCCSVYAR